jgi:acetylornithine/succinyldiaminopimelate/putrescine aminotransferase
VESVVDTETKILFKFKGKNQANFKPPLVIGEEEVK